ncbi:hypothetical protein AeRB84_018093 [Aphanomyces euteiches]|nr:hypothetical protein AeRB84_018093 [Aphanomyces euteiches]
MGSSISMLRADIKAHVQIALDYPNLLEPHLHVVRFFLELCEEGEGITPKDRDNAEVLERIKENDFEVSTEVELVAENVVAVDILLGAVEKYNEMVPAPEFDTKKRYFARFRAPEPFPTLYDPVEEVDLPRCRVSLLRMALRCLRMITVIDDVKKQVRESSAVPAFNRAVDDNPLDLFIRKDVKAIFKSALQASLHAVTDVVDVYGGEQSLKCLEDSSLAVTVEVMTDFPDMEKVQLAAIKRLAVVLTSFSGTSSSVFQGIRTSDVDPAQLKAHVLSNQVISAVGVALATYPETRFDIYAHSCRLFTILVPPKQLKEDEEIGRPHDETLAKVIGQNGGVEAAIKLLKTCRGFYTTSHRVSPKNNPPQDDNRQPDKIRNDTPNQDDKEKLTDWTTPDLAQQALWALDVLSITEFNRIAMKREKLKYVLSEISLGSKLILPRRLRLLDWKNIGFESEDR